MKPILTFFLTTFFVTITFAQKGINYKALVKDANNTPLSNQNITIEFSILEGPEIDFLDVLYTETHAASTDANGIVIVNIGEGTPSTGFDEHDYEDLDWGHPFFSHFLKVQIDSGSGLTDMGTTEFKAVPYALYALNSNNTNTGLELINEGSSQGWRLIGKNPDFYGIIGYGAVDLSQSGSDDGTNGASGSNSFASGINTKAIGTQSTALGAGTIASGHTSVALGQSTRAEAPNSTAIGLYNIGGGDPLLASSTDPLFEIGNGTYSGGTDNGRSNALTVLRNGTITAPSFDISEITDAKSLITKEYFEANGSATGLEALDEGNGIGWRLIGSDPNKYGNIGYGAIDLSISDNTPSDLNGALGNYSFAAGNFSRASATNTIAIGYSADAYNSGSVAIGTTADSGGNNSIALGFHAQSFSSYSTAIGYYAVANQNNAISIGESTMSSGIASVALGSNTTASGDYAFATGLNATANGNYSLAIGKDTNASVNYATAIGQNTTASGLYSSALGLNSIASGNYSTALGTGTTASGLYSTAFGASTIAAGGYSTALGNLTEATAENSTAMGLGTIANNPSSLVIGEYNDLYSNVLFQIGNGNGNGTDPGTFRANAMTVYNNGHVLAFAYDLASDKRLKSNISNLEYGLNTILKLNPVAYNWKRSPDEKDKTFGLIAQEIQPIIKEIVTIGNDKDKTLSINYTELIPVLIKAIQEQQDIIKIQDSKISGLTADLEQLKTIDQRVKQLETLINDQQ